MDTKKKFTSSSGFEYSLDLDVLDDWDIWENELTVMEDKDAPTKVRDAATKKVFIALIGGEDEFDRLKAFLKEQDGQRVRRTAVVREMTEVFKGATPDKKK